MHGQLQLDSGGREKGTEEGKEGAVYITCYVARICIDTGGTSHEYSDGADFTKKVYHI